MFYKTLPGQSPAMIARKLGTSVAALLAANPHKPTTIVAGKHTWHGLHYNELVHVPRMGGHVGALGTPGTLGAVTPADPNAPHALIKQGSYGADVALWQTILGVTADGSFGPKTATATRAWQSAHGTAPDGIVGPTTWAAALGSLVAPAPAATAATAPSSSLASAASAAGAALFSDPNYCTSVGRIGTAVNTAVHNFKVAWNAANPSNPVPIGTGKYEPVVATALSVALKGQAVPPGCGATVAQQPATTPVQQPVQVKPATTQQPAQPAPTGGNPAQSAATVMASALAAHGYKRADQALYAAFQRAAGLSADGFPGAGTMRALASVLTAAGIPVPNVKVYPWRSTGAYDGVNAPTTTEWTGAAAPAPSGGGGAQAIGACFHDDGTPTWACPPETYTAWNAAQATAKAAAQAIADATAAAAKAATKAQADAAAATAQAAVDAAAKAAAAATTQAQKDAADAAAKLAQAALDAAAAKGGGGGGGGGGGLVAPEEKKKVSTGAIVAGAVGAAALVGLIALAATKKPAHRGARGARGARGPAKRKKATRKSSAGRKKAKRK